MMKPILYLNRLEDCFVDFKTPMRLLSIDAKTINLEEEDKTANGQETTLNLLTFLMITLV
jgi:hypothetical protein